MYSRVDLRVCVVLPTEMRGQYGIPVDSFQEVPRPDPAHYLVLHVTVCGPLLSILARVFYDTFTLQFVVLLPAIFVFSGNRGRWFLEELHFEGFVIKD